MKLLGKFGEFAKQYENARRPYPPEVFKYLKSLLKAKYPLILDLGCGTGISTRQLVKIGKLTGADPDPKMLRLAKKHKNSGVKNYIVARADKLPFKNETFDVITAFSAFHWFTDKKSTKEIKRVLKPNGIFFTVGKVGIKSWGEGYRQTIIKTIGRQIAPFLTDRHRPEKVLRSSGFKNIKSKSWKKSEYFTLTGALNYVQSLSVWHTAPKLLRDKALKGLEVYYKNIKKLTGKIERRLAVKAVVGIKA